VTHVPLEIRAARDEDAAAIARLSIQLGYPQSEDDVRRRLLRISDARAGEVLVAVDGEGRVVAWTHVFLGWRLESDVFAELGGLVVDERVRNAGVGGRLLRAAEEWAAARGIASMRVRSNTIREDAHRFYLTRGYTTTKSQAVFDKPLAVPAADARPLFRGTISRIVVFPVKSLDGHDVKEARILPGGALEHDRRFAIVGRDGAFVNGKRNAHVHRIRSRYDPVSRTLAVRSNEDADPRVFHVDGERAALESWLGASLGLPVELHENPGGGFPDDRDAPGPTLVAASTLEEVARWFPGATAAAMARRFRVNLVVDGFPPFGDDALVGTPSARVQFRVGELTFEGVNPCRRCAVPTRDPESGEGDARFAKVFAERRRETLPAWAPRERFDHFYRFTVNTRLVGPAEGGTIRAGDVVDLA
jgi:uncharacterized protein YcbX/GNAT superfamily N-acetyltransferase